MLLFDNPVASLAAFDELAPVVLVDQGHVARDGVVVVRVPFTVVNVLTRPFWRRITSVGIKIRDVMSSQA